MATSLAVKTEGEMAGTASVADASQGARWRLAATLVVVFLLAVGAMEDWYGRTDAGDVFGSDAVQYLDCARAIGRGDLKSALNPLWSQGYPALLALVRPVFPGGMTGDWWTTRATNFLVFGFCMAAFAYLLAAIAPRRRDGVFWLCGAGVFASAEVCLGQVSRVGPDELVAAFFFLACGMLLRLVRQPKAGVAAIFGLILGLGFLAKAVFLPLGCVLLALLLWGLWRAGHGVRAVLPAALVFGVIVLLYGAMLSRAVGHRTLGDSGSLNYAWHVNRLAKWVHWEGGTESATEAWPSARLARLAQWESQPPDFGRPIHPSATVGHAPTVYVFHEPVTATYVPYYDPDYWYEGYRHLFRWRYQAIAVAKSLTDLAKSLAMQPMLYAVLRALWLLRGFWDQEQATKGTRRAQRLREDREGEQWLGERKPWTGLVVAAAALGVAIYLPVHLEGRYLSGFLAVLAMCGLAAVMEATVRTRRAVLAVVLAGAAVQMVQQQHVVWGRAVHGWTYRDNVEWKAAAAVAQSGLPRGSEIGMISWTANLYCDWAYLAGMRITSEIANSEDEKTFWGMSQAGQDEVLARFKAAGAKAVLSWDGPPSGVDAGWVKLAGTKMWMYRF